MTASKTYRDPKSPSSIRCWRPGRIRFRHPRPAPKGTTTNPSLRPATDVDPTPRNKRYTTQGSTSAPALGSRQHASARRRLLRFERGDETTSFEANDRRIRIAGAREHNLRDVDLELPRQRWIAVTGPSGSGKTSLVTGTVVAESQRRYLATLSARARHYLGQLGRPSVDGISGLPVAIAVGQSSTTGNVRSTVGTLTGIQDFLRLLFARAAIDPQGAALSRSHFSFNHPLGQCEACGGLGVVDRVDPELLIADSSKSIRDGALVPTLKNGYTVYSQVTLEVMNQICEAHGFDVHTPWATLTGEQRDVVLYGTKALRVPFGKHSIESRMRWKGITARPRETGFYRGLVPVIEETLARSRNPGVLRFVRSTPCSTCGGSRLSRPGREATVGSYTLPALLAQSVVQLEQTLQMLPRSPVWDVLEPSVVARLERMRRLSLQHLSLDRSSTTLSGGEAQRIRLAAQLSAGLGGLLVSVDEPTLGLHPQAGASMAAVLRELVEVGNTLVTVEHDPDMVRHADHLVEIGPGAGPEGGTLVYNGELPTDPLGGPPTVRERPRPHDGEIVLRGATLHNLKQASLKIRLGTINVVVGPSGAGKSSLVFGTLWPALAAQTGGPYRSLEGADGRKLETLDARPLGRTSRSTPATFSGLFDLIRARFAATEEARRQGFKAGRFSYNNKDGRCPTCEGLGVLRVGMHLVADAEIPCPTCGGQRYAPPTLEVKRDGLSIADVLQLSVQEACDHFADDEAIARLAGAMNDLGLGYLKLGQRSASLSRGEGQRLKLAAILGKAAVTPSVLLLDEPDRGLHPSDVQRLLDTFAAMVEQGHTIVAISHHRHVWAAADYVTELRDGVATEVELGELHRLSQTHSVDASPPAVRDVQLAGVIVHNLRGVDVRIPHDAVTVVTGVSGSGKSSLVFHALAAEAWHRYAESLPFAVRRFVRQLPRPSVQTVAGLRPVVALRQGQPVASSRSTVATQSELGPLLRTLWSRAGLLDGAPCGLTAEHFSPDRPLGACPACDGLGTVSRCDPELLLTDPSRPLMDGAFAGTRPGKFLCARGGQHMATLQAAAAGADLDRPWCDLESELQRLILEGDPDRSLHVRWDFERGGRKGRHDFEATWDGLCRLVERESERRAQSKQAAAWAAPLRDLPCRACDGARLRPEVASVVVGRWTLPALMQLPVSGVVNAMSDVELDARQAAVVDALRPIVLERLEELRALGLGHLALARRSPTLSEGERQRVRLAGVLRSGLTDTMVVLDEPAAGLHPEQGEAVLRRLRHLRDLGNTVVVVSHRPELIAGADHLIDMGPGAGETGGTIVDEGPVADVLAGDGPTATALRRNPRRSRPRDVAEEAWIEIVGAHVHNLANLDVRLPASGFVAVSGVSGSGKSTLIFDVLQPSAQRRRAVGCREVRGLPAFAEVVSYRRPSLAATPLGALGLMPALQKHFAEAAKERGVPKQAMSFASPAGRCEVCKGSGRKDVAMDVLADLSLPCPACEGRRYRPEVLDVQVDGLNVADLLEMPASAARSHVGGKLGAGLADLERVALGHISLGRRCRELSGGERQRLSLATALRAKATPALLLLDEPATGLHEGDLDRLFEVFEALASRGSLVVAAEHRTSLLRAADWVVDLGPGGGPQGGRLVASGRPDALREGSTARYVNGSAA